MQRYLDYLSIAYGKIGELGRPAMDATMAVYSDREGGVLTEDELELLEVSRRLHTELHLYHESLFLFADILLDRVAGTVEFYFGQARGCSLSSHHNLQRHLVEYARALDLEAPPERLLELVSEAQSTIGDTRDALIAHRRDPRGLSWGTLYELSTGETWIGQTVLYPRSAGEVSRDAPRPDEVMSIVVSYVTELFAYIALNRQHARLRDRAACTASGSRRLRLTVLSGLARRCPIDAQTPRNPLMEGSGESSRRREDVPANQTVPATRHHTPVNGWNVPPD